MTAQSFRGMGTTIEVHGDSKSMRQVHSLFGEYEQRFSRFQPGTELSEINCQRGSSIEVSADMRDVLEVARTMRERTGGLVDIGVGLAVRQWGYDTTFDDVTDMPAAPTVHGEVSWSIDDGVVTLGSTTQLDLGGIVKGWACDRAVEMGLADMVSAGGDLRSVDDSLVVEIVDENDEPVTDIYVGVGALATSSIRVRRWVAGDVDAHHVIDPRTMAPSTTPIHAASVIADTAVEAEAGAKAVLLLGVDGLSWADDQAWIRQAVVRWHDASVYAIAGKVTS